MYKFGLISKWYLPGRCLSNPINWANRETLIFFNVPFWGNKSSDKVGINDRSDQLALVSFYSNED